MSVVTTSSPAIMAANARSCSPVVSLSSGETGGMIYAVISAGVSDDMEENTVNSQPQDDHISVRILVTGRVQGVGFRQTARQQARLLGIEASAYNRQDGSVLVETTGPRETIEKLIAWAHKGPALAQVDDVTVINTRRTTHFLHQAGSSSTGNSPTNM